MTLHAQEIRKPLKSKESEQNEAKATQHLELELQKKQLLMNPQILKDSCSLPKQKEQLIKKKKGNKTPAKISAGKKQ
jgi:hypothetical protein